MMECEKVLIEVVMVVAAMVVAVVVAVVVTGVDGGLLMQCVCIMMSLFERIRHRV